MRCLLAKILLFSFVAVNGQVTKKQAPKKLPPARLSIGAGIARSVLYLTRNVKENNDARGFHTSITYQNHGQLRYVLEFTKYWPIDIAPTWYNVSAYTVEFNVNAMFRVADGDGYFYPVAGLSYNRFNGYFTGTADFLNIRANHPAQSWVQTAWVGLNVGTGYEHRFKRLAVYGDYKMRVGITEDKRQLNIMDVCLDAGIRWYVGVKPLRQIFRGTRSRYLLRVKDNED